MSLETTNLNLLTLREGEIEATLMTATSRMANLKALLSDNPEIRSQVAEAVKVYERESRRDYRGVHLAQILDPTDSHFDVESKSKWASLSPLEREMLQSYLSYRYTDLHLAEWTTTASIMEQISLQGVRYARQNVLKYDQDSHIIFQVPGTDPLVWAPGKILNIFQYWHTTSDGNETKDIYFVVERFRTDLDLPSPDPYQQYPSIFGYLAGATIETRIIESSHVHCHFALTPIEFNGQTLIHVFPQTRVSHRPCIIR